MAKGSDMTKFEDFIGEWISKERDHPQTSDPSKDDYYPPQGVKIRFKKDVVESQGTDRRTMPVAVVEVELPPGTVWRGKAGVEKAYYYFRDGRLYSTPIESEVLDENDKPISFSEALEMEADGTMRHYLLWSDGDLGCWGCFGG